MNLVSKVAILASGTDTVSQLFCEVLAFTGVAGRQKGGWVCIEELL
jgi:hypothetical protein